MNSVFDDHYNDYDSWYDRNKYVYLSELKAINRFLPKQGRGLEIGVGTGRFAGALNIDFGIDLSKGMLDAASKRGVKVLLGSGESLPFKDSSFDYVAIIISLCFIKEPKKALKEVRRALSKNGKIIIALVNKDSFLGEFYRKKKSIFYKEAIFLSVEEVVGMLKTEGFKKFDFLQTVFNLPDKIDAVCKPERGYDRGGFVVISAQK